MKSNLQVLNFGVMKNKLVFNGIDMDLLELYEKKKSCLSIQSCKKKKKNQYHRGAERDELSGIRRNSHRTKKRSFLEEFDQLYMVTQQ